MFDWLARSSDAEVAGLTPIGDAHRLVDLERAADAPAPEGCAWLDEATIADLELADVVHGIDRTVSPTGAQQLWRMVAAPALRLDVIAERERSLAMLAADPPARAQLRKVLAGAAEPDTAYVPLLLWSDTPAPLLPGWGSQLMAGALLACIAGVFVWPVLILPAMLLFVANVVLDDRGNVHLAQHARALQMFGRVLAVAERVVREELGPPNLRAAIAAELPALGPLRKKLAMLSVNDPLDISGVVSAGFQMRLIAMASCLDLLKKHREPMRRLHRLVGELDALQAIATWRAERPDVSIPELVEGGAELEVDDIRHPGIAGAIGNSIDLGAQSLVVTGSNMSGKSTFLRTLAVNAVLAQSIHTVCGTWRGAIVRVHAAMRAVDATGEGLSTYAAEVATVGTLVAAAEPSTPSPPALLVLDEPFRGTNPMVRVPIVVAVLEYLARENIVIAATHDLDVAKRLSEVFERGCFRELDDEDGTTFDFRLRPGMAVTTNAVALLRRAGYPAAILDALT